jgi:hypothetical protein
MIDSIRKRFVAAAAVVVALCAVGSGSAATHEFQPFVTDFPTVATPATASFIPGVTDFGLSTRLPGGSFVVGATAPSNPVGDSGLDWGDVGAGAGMGIAITVLIAAAGLGLARRRGSGRLGPARTG